MKPVRTRFAPSPTGFLHVGGIRTALFNYLFAKHHNGTFILRLEDTDRERFVAEGVAQIVEGLDWAGLKPDEGFWVSEGKHYSIDYVQSERQKTGLYQKCAEQLVAAGLAYYSPTSPTQLELLRKQAAQEKQAFLYKKALDEQNSDQKVVGVPIRFDVSAQAKKSQKWQDFIEWDDLVIGHTHQKYEDIEDFIIIKSDGFPTYNFANVIDDLDMNITHILRGQEFVASTPKHLMLYEAIGSIKNKFTIPEFAHLPVINGSDGKKLSKRTGDTNVLDYRDKGYLPEALLNFLALLGWNDGTEQELFSMHELTEKFSLERVNNSPAVFDRKRLDWMNGHYIRELKLDDLYRQVQDFWPSEASSYSATYRKAVLSLIQERLKYFAELPELTRFFFVDLPIDHDLIATHKQLGKLTPSELKHLLEQSMDVLKDSDFSHTDLRDKLNKLLEKTGRKPVVLFSLIRVATTQAPASPELASTLAVLGKDITIRRINHQLKHVQ